MKCFYFIKTNQRNFVGKFFFLAPSRIHWPRTLDILVPKEKLPLESKRENELLLSTQYRKNSTQNGFDLPFHFEKIC